MKKKILSHTSFMIVLTAILTFIAASFLMYEKFDEAMKRTVRDETEYVKEGMEKGSELATENINKLLKILIVEKKYDEIEKISENKEYQKELMKKYNIIED